MSERRSNRICAVVDRPDDGGNDLVYSGNAAVEVEGSDGRHFSVSRHCDGAAYLLSVADLP